MDENYLNQLLGGNYFTSSDVTMNYPIWTSTARYDGGIIQSSSFGSINFWEPFSRKEVSFIKKEIPKFNIFDTTI